MEIAVSFVFSLLFFCFWTKMETRFCTPLTSLNVTHGLFCLCMSSCNRSLNLQILQQICEKVPFTPSSFLWHLVHSRNHVEENRVIEVIIFLQPWKVEYCHTLLRMPFVCFWVPTVLFPICQWCSSWNPCERLSIPVFIKRMMFLESAAGTLLQFCSKNRWMWLKMKGY